MTMSGQHAPLWIVRGVGAVQILFGVTVIASCAAGVDMGTGTAMPVMLLTGTGFALLR
ncbi:hypothetical protein ACWF9G_02200 [Nocardia sp. NPDC055029]